MNIATRELCQELYELSGWDSSIAGGDARWCLLEDSQWELLRLSDAASYQPPFSEEWFAGIPAYDLGYLLRKLPKGVYLYVGRKSYQMTTGNMSEYIGRPHTRYRSGAQDTPEDAACKLAIELFKQGILSKEAQ